jgi:hypothetical protein
MISIAGSQHSQRYPRRAAGEVSNGHRLMVTACLGHSDIGPGARAGKSYTETLIRQR